MLLVIFYTMESIWLLINAVGPIEPEHFFTYILLTLGRVFSSPRHCSVYNSVTKFNSMLLVIFYNMEPIRLLINAIWPIECEHFFIYIVTLGRVFSSPRHCSVYNSVSQFDSMLLVIFYTMESNRLLVNTFRPIERQHFFTYSTVLLEHNTVTMGKYSPHQDIVVSLPQSTSSILFY